MAAGIRRTRAFQAKRTPVRPPKMRKSDLPGALSVLPEWNLLGGVGRNTWFQAVLSGNGWRAFGGEALARLPDVRQLSRLILVAFVVALVAVHVAQAQGLTPLVIATRTGEHRFRVEFVATPEARSRGLMYRRSLPADRGMLFDFGRDEDVGMWMHNTYIPLDMLFIRADGRVARVERSTTPFSTDLIRAGEPVRAVLELNAGTARRIGLAAGDVVRHAMFGDAP
jgi:uncharacterized membrane protein (UPF0127 family)